jgi:hypothetical protein
MRAREAHMSEEDIMNLPPIEGKTQEELVRKFINKMDVRYSLFSELYTRGTRPHYPTTLQEAHKEIERFGPNDTR